MSAATGVSPPADPAQHELARAYACAANVPDPEIPVLTLEDLGILRGVSREDGHIVATLTPTYTGCPATEAIADDVRAALAEGGFPDARVRLVLAPPWTTDWISDDGRRKLRDYGIAPPGRPGDGAAGGARVLRFVPRAAAVTETIACPRCSSTDVERLSEHGSTPCKALYRCIACREPFDYFKPY